MANTHRYTQAMVIDALTASAGIFTDAALKLNCSRQTVANYVNNDNEIQSALNDIVASTVDLAETKLIEKIRSGNMTSIIFYLKTKGKDRGYVEGRELTGKNDRPIKTEYTTPFADLPRETQDRLMAEFMPQGITRTVED